MQSSSKHISYASTGKFTTLVEHYLAGHPDLDAFYAYKPDLKGFAQCIKNRGGSRLDRRKIRDFFSLSYDNARPSPRQLQNIESLLDEKTFTVCTAHQPNIFSGYLYFIYKTVHAIVLANHLNKSFPENRFVPVFYIGSEDNDLEELSRFKLHGHSYTWDTDQTGAVGRMKVDEGIKKLIGQIEAELSHLPYSKELLDKIRSAYAPGTDIANAIFILLNQLFSEDGLLVLQPDHQSLKETMKSVFRDDLLENIADSIVSKTNERLERKFHLQVTPRRINLFYLRDGVRNRIDRQGNLFIVDGTDIKFSQKEILLELDHFPDRFSPNVILRGLYQETILPNIAFIGGGAELAYWMQLKELFDHYGIPYPVLVLRNSFLIMNDKQEHKLNELGIELSDLFRDETKLANEMVIKWSGKTISLADQISQAKSLFANLKNKSAEIDKSLDQHVHALEHDMLKKIDTLEKKMLKAERKNQAVQLQRIWKLKGELFPSGNLQERVENFMPFYAAYGPEFLRAIINHSQALEQEFTALVLS